MAHLLTKLLCCCAVFVAFINPTWSLNYQKRNLQTITAIYNRTVYPANLAFLQNGTGSVPAGLFNPNASGRVSPVGNFSGFQESTEYFFALAPVPRAPTYVAFTKAQIVEFTSGCPEVAASVVYFTNSVVNATAADNGKYITTLKQVAFWKFDREGAVLYYDAWIPNLAPYNAIQTTTLTPQVEAGEIEQLCGAVQQECVGGNTQYNSTADCVRTLSGKPFGDWDEVWGDNVVCRQVHAILAAVDPVVHCPHVGPTGGGKCVNEPYNEGYFDDEALFGSPEGQTFMCK
ncbi:MAG: hypothetical protein FRX48_02477 [Lasallia pustulata]|uniref:Uncharacterized protein n=1 Tax=Lasallia pustulata TaxID=136370 RepID=A0A5M8PWV1_9LECA|nr:MAG: hypothetical protein FRX48_02477 [Lasallia pustulata]